MPAGGLTKSNVTPQRKIVMSLRTHMLVAALAAASWSVAPVALSQVEEPQPPASTPEDTSEATPAPEAAQPDATQPGATQPDAAAPAPSTANAAPIDDKKIEQFANAYIEVQTIQQKAANQLQTATDPAQADKVKAAAETDMIAAVERSGLQVDEFNHIVESMASDVNVRSRIAAELQERSGGT
jgi:hypothetical protein